MNQDKIQLTPNSSRDSSQPYRSLVTNIDPDYSGNSTGGDFPSKQDKQRINQGRDYEKIWSGKFYENQGEAGVFQMKHFFEKDREKQRILALSINVARMIVTKTTRFFVGGQTAFTVTAGENAEKLQEAVDGIVERSGLRQLLRQEVCAFQVHGYSTMRAILDEKTGKSTIEGVAYSNTFPIFDINGKRSDHVIGKYLLRGKGNERKQFFYAQHYFQKDGAIFIEHKLFRSSGFEVKEPVNFAELGQEFADLQGRVDKTTALSELPIVQIEEMKLGSEQFSAGVIENIRSATEEICDCLNRISSQFIKHLSAKIAIPKSALDIEINQDGREVVQSKNLEVIPIEEGDPIPQYITNSNPLIEQQFVELERLLDMIAAAAEVPEKFVGREQRGGVEKVETKKLGMSEFLRKIEDYQATFADGLQNLIKMALLLEGYAVPDDFAIQVGFREGLPRDMDSELRVHTTAVDAGIESKKRAMMSYHGFSEDEYEAEQQQIEKEEKESLPSLDFPRQNEL